MQGVFFYYYSWYNLSEIRTKEQRDLWETKDVFKIYLGYEFMFGSKRKQNQSNLG